MSRSLPDWALVHRELGRKGVTPDLLRTVKSALYVGDRRPF
jgi:hypothetical protein